MTTQARDKLTLAGAELLMKKIRAYWLKTTGTQPSLKVVTETDKHGLTIYAIRSDMVDAMPVDSRNV